MKRLFPSLSTGAVVPASDSAQIVIDEIEERKLRECNLIIFNTDDSDVDNYDIDDDVQLVASVLRKVNNIKTVFTSSNVKRLGMYEVNKKRPILVKMRHHNEVSNVLMHWNLISKPYTVSFDLTPYQREQFKMLKNEADKFNAEHDISKRKKVVRFIKGNSKIFKLDFNKKNKNGNKSKNNSKNVMSQWGEL